jgi:hypothetical protein
MAGRMRIWFRATAFKEPKSYEDEITGDIMIRNEVEGSSNTSWIRHIKLRPCYIIVGS